MHKNPKNYTLAQEHYLRYSYGFHLQKLNEIKSQKGLFQESPFALTPHNIQANKPKRNWRFEVTLENNCLVKKMKEIQLQTKQSQQKLKSAEKAGLKTLNIVKRINDIKKIMEENQFLHKRLQKVHPTINVKKINESYKENIKHSEIITKFSRRTINCFLIKGKSPPKTAISEKRIFERPERREQTEKRENLPAPAISIQTVDFRLSPGLEHVINKNKEKTDNAHDVEKHENDNNSNENAELQRNTENNVAEGQEGLEESNIKNIIDKEENNLQNKDDNEKQEKTEAINMSLNGLEDSLEKNQMIKIEKKNSEEKKEEDKGKEEEKLV